ncbi:helix-turn-helix domain-containing protein [Providencia huaxiensis]|uniref:helix-turn-helix domain-containing protein n=1 Tax=Providencia huaxiensis TaxID=2027290 RepID=UPI0032DBC419
MQLPKQDLTHLFIDFGRDWESDAILTALKKRGISIKEIEEKMGVKKNCARNVFYRSYPKAEEIIAEAIGVEPYVIWPSRYSSEAQASA